MRIRSADNLTTRLAACCFISLPENATKDLKVLVGLWVCVAVTAETRPIGEMIIYHEPNQCKKCANKSTYISSQPLLQQKLKPLSSRIPVAVLLMLPIILVLEAEKESLRSVKMMHVRHVGIVRLVSLRRCG